MKSSRPQRKTRPPERMAALILSPLAFLKLTYFCHAAATEVGGFAVSSPDHPLYVEDITVLQQLATPVTTDLDDEAVADYVESQALAGIEPARCGRIWVHTHPGSSATPSYTDEETFARCFGGCDWSVMAILARGGEWYARLHFAAGPAGNLVLPVLVDWSAWPSQLRTSAGELQYLQRLWQEQLETLVVEPPQPIGRSLLFGSDELDEADWKAWAELHLDEKEVLDGIE